MSREKSRAAIKYLFERYYKLMRERAENPQHMSKRYTDQIKIIEKKMRKFSDCLEHHDSEIPRF